jgi:hypothetical protein
MRAYKFRCSNCNQNIESATLPMSTIECPTCKYTFVPAQFEEIEKIDKEDGAAIGETDRPKDRLAVVVKQAESAESDADIWIVAGVVALFLCIVIAVIVGSGNDASWITVVGILGGFVPVWILCCLMSRLAKIHATLLRSRQDALLFRSEIVARSVDQK